MKLKEKEDMVMPFFSVNLGIGTIQTKTISIHQSPRNVDDEPARRAGEEETISIHYQKFAALVREKFRSTQC